MYTYTTYVRTFVVLRQGTGGFWTDLKQRVTGSASARVLQAWTR